MHGLPIEAQKDGCPLHIGAGLEHRDRERLEEQRETRMLAGPGKSDRLDAARGTVAARRPRSQEGLKLHGVQMPPRPLGRQIGLRTVGPAFGTSERAAGMLKKNLDRLAFQGKVDAADCPRVAQTEQRPIVIRQFAHAARLGRAAKDGSDTHEIPRRTIFLLTTMNDSIEFTMIDLSSGPSYEEVSMYSQRLLTPLALVMLAVGAAVVLAQSQTYDCFTGGGANKCPVGTTCTYSAVQSCKINKASFLGTCLKSNKQYCKNALCPGVTTVTGVSCNCVFKAPNDCN